MFPPPGVSGGDDGDVFGHPVVQTLVDLAGGAGARVVAQPHPQCLPRPTGEVVAHKCQQTVHTDNEWFYIFRTSRPIGCSQLIKGVAVHNFYHDCICIDMNFHLHKYAIA